MSKRYTLTLADMSRLNRLPMEDDHERPIRRGDCELGPRPCPFVGCRYHLYLDVNPRSGHVKLNYGDTPVEKLEHSCALDLADERRRSLDEVAHVMAMTRRNVFNIQRRACARLEGSSEAHFIVREDLKS